MDKSLDEALAYSNRWLDLIKTPVVTEEQGKQIIEESTVQLRRALQQGLAGLPQIGDRGRRLGRDRMDRLRRDLSRCAGPRVHRLPGRLRDDGPGLVPPGGGGRGARPAGPHAHAQPGADRPAARRAGAPDGRRSPPATSSTASSAPAAPRRSKAPSSWPRCTPARAVSSWRSRPSTARRWAR